MNKYRELTECIHVPNGLNERVMKAVREDNRGMTGHRVIRGAVCAACALALLMGTFSLRQTDLNVPDQSGTIDEMPAVPSVLDYTFGITAGAVENAVNGGLIFRWEDGCGSFRIRGENIAEICLETSKGILLRDGITLGSCVRELFDANAVYGLSAANGEDMESLDRVELLLTVIFTDGTVKEERYTLHAEKLRVFFNEDGREVLVPALKGDSDGRIPALYLEDVAGRWLSWPVSDSQTVSLSMSYGFKERFNADSGAFHTGIDIPGAAGMEIAAAEAGGVVEAGFDSRRGNYLVLDHGDGLTTLYAHCRELLVNQGDTVERDQTIAMMGSTGMSTGPHLHFEVRQNGEAQNPVAYFTDEIRDALHAK